MDFFYWMLGVLVILLVWSRKTWEQDNYLKQQKVQTEIDLDRINYLDCWLLHCVNKNHPDWLDFEAERNKLRCRLLRRGINV